MRPNATAPTLSAGGAATRVVVLGSSISGLMTATWLKQKQPDLEVVVLGPRPGDEKRPVVGESTVEPMMLFLVELGLKPTLQARHELKNGLTFYHKLAIDDPSDRRYSVHAPAEELHYHSRQLHRPAFDRQLAEVARGAGVVFVEGKATELTVGTGGGLHRVQGKAADGTGLDWQTRFLVDCTGRRRLLGKQVTRYLKPPADEQRCAFWFRLADFDPLLPKLDLSMRRPHDYDLWQSTHHFMGRGNWVWGIPLKGDAGEPMLSMGITWRPGVFPADVRSMDDFLAWVETEHPAVAEMVRSGRVIDSHHYRNYLYCAEQVYSADGWFLVGDAARSVDPLYSTGLSMSAIQIQQVDRIIRDLRRSAIDADGVGGLEALWMTLADLRQEDITDQYVSMHDPLQACMRRYWNLCVWFNGLLPLWFNGYCADPKAARPLLRFFKKGIPASKAAWRLFADVSARLGPVEPAEFDRLVDFDRLINRPFDCDPAALGRTVSRLPRKRAQVRLNLVRLGGLGLLPGQLKYIARESVMSVVVRTLLFRLPALRDVERQLTFSTAQMRDVALQPR